MNDHYQELIAVSKEALKRKRSTEVKFAGLKQTVRNLQQQNRELTRRMTEMETEQQKDEIEVSYSENKLMIDENALVEPNNQENPSFHDTSTELLPEDEEIFRKLNIPWLPIELQKYNRKQGI